MPHIDRRASADVAAGRRGDQAAGDQPAQAGLVLYAERCRGLPVWPGWRSRAGWLACAGLRRLSAWVLPCRAPRRGVGCERRGRWRSRNSVVAVVVLLSRRRLVPHPWMTCSLGLLTLVLAPEPQRVGPLVPPESLRNSVAVQSRTPATSPARPEGLASGPHGDRRDSHLVPMPRWRSEERPQCVPRACGGSLGRESACPFHQRDPLTLPVTTTSFVVITLIATESTEL